MCCCIVCLNRRSTESPHEQALPKESHLERPPRCVIHCLLVGGAVGGAHHYAPTPRLGQTWLPGGRELPTGAIRITTPTWSGRPRCVRHTVRRFRVVRAVHHAQTRRRSCVHARLRVAALAFGAHTPIGHNADTALCRTRPPQCQRPNLTQPMDTLARVHAAAERNVSQLVICGARRTVPWGAEACVQAES